jgi:hypothetical protein
MNTPRDALSQGSTTTTILEILVGDDLDKTLNYLCRNTRFGNILVDRGRHPARLMIANP